MRVCDGCLIGQCWDGRKPCAGSAGIIYEKYPAYTVERWWESSFRPLILEALAQVSCLHYFVMLERPRLFLKFAVRIACVPLKSIVLAPRVKTMPSRPRLRLSLPSCTPTICNLVHDHSTKRRGHQSPHRTACYARVLIQSSINQPGRYGRRGHTNPFLTHPVPWTTLLPKHLEGRRRQRSFDRLVAPTLQLLLRQRPISTCAPLCVACSRALSGSISRSGSRT